MSWESPTRRRQEKLPGYRKVKEHFLAASKTLSWWSRLQDARQFHRSSKRPFTEGFIEDDAVRLTESPEEATRSMKARSLLMKLNLPSAVTDAGGDALVEAKGEKTRSKEGMIGSTLRENHNLFTQFPKNPNCEVCNRTEKTRASCSRKANMPAYGVLLSTKSGHLITAGHTMLTVENEPSSVNKNTLIAQDD